MSSSTMLDRLKPRRSDAISRIRANGMGLFAVLVAMNLLPVPGPWDATLLVWQSYSRKFGSMEAGPLWWAACFAELAIVAALTFNVLQATYALKYPPAPLPPTAPSTPKPNPAAMAAKSPKSSAGLGQSQRRLVGVTPTTPQPQKSFSSSFYASSPASTPSRTLNYSTFSGTGGADTSFGSSFSSSLNNTPSPVGGLSNASLLGMSVSGSPSLAAYRGKHRAPAGRAFDGDLLNRLTQSQGEEDEDDG
ncbi:hypothetical protein BDW22DRAFT_1266337 [Trametopsis cervina]|nr:hypothetical protein BDW22DRAFT_1266337 [Trametopsis cervina]